MAQQAKAFATKAWWPEFTPETHMKVGESHLHTVVSLSLFNFFETESHSVVLTGLELAL